MTTSSMSPFGLILVLSYRAKDSISEKFTRELLSLFSLKYGGVIAGYRVVVDAKGSLVVLLEGVDVYVSMAHEIGLHAGVITDGSESRTALCLVKVYPVDSSSESVFVGGSVASITRDGTVRDSSVSIDRKGSLVFFDILDALLSSKLIFTSSIAGVAVKRVYDFLSMSTEPLSDYLDILPHSSYRCSEHFFKG